MPYEEPTSGATKPCPHCGEPILVKALKCRFCHRWMPVEAAEREAEPQFHATAPSFEPRAFSNGQPRRHFILLSVLTLGLYELYWFYRNWRELREEIGIDVSPGWRTFGLLVPFVNVFMVYQQLRLIHEVAASRGIPVAYSPSSMTALFFAIGLVANVTFIWIISLLTVFALLPAQDALNRFWSQAQPGKPIRESFLPYEIAILTAGALFTALALVRTVG